MEIYQQLIKEVLHHIELNRNLLLKMKHNLLMERNLFQDNHKYLKNMEEI
jgi:hypothetical protein